jgi:hypothetical protein
MYSIRPNHRIVANQFERIPMTATAKPFAASIDEVRPDNNGHDELPLPLELIIHDRDIINALKEYPEGDDRNQYAIEAMKIGILALRHVGGQVSADRLRDEGDRFIVGLQKTLDQHKQTVQEQIESKLKEYFDPKSGRFEERVQRLVAQDGDLSRLMRGFIDGENCIFTKTMLTHVGRDSALMKQLDPKQSDGLLAVLKQLIELELSQQRDHILREFSLNNKEGALSRLTKELSESNNEIVKEFSLNEKNSALSRLVYKVRKAQRTITNEFKLENDTSCLSRLKKELTALLEASELKNQRFREDVNVALAKIVTTRQEADRSTRHGLQFQDAVCEFLVRETQHVGDIAIPTGHLTGLIKNCKVGDCVVELGPDSAAPGAKVAVEAKEEIGYSLARARQEIETARKNRGADWGLFVFSKKTAPAGLEPFQRYGNDIVVIWDADDPTCDVFLKAGIIAARALCFRAERQSAAQQIDLDAIEKAILEIEKRAGNLDEVRKSADTIQTASGKILERIRKDRDALEKQVEVLRERVKDLRAISSPTQ